VVVLENAVNAEFSPGADPSDAYQSEDHIPKYMLITAMVLHGRSL